MKLDIVYFAWLRSNLGINSESVEAPDDIETVGGLVRWLSDRSPAHAGVFADMKTVRCAVNLEFATEDATIKDGDEVGFFPPVTGG